MKFNIETAGLRADFRRERVEADFLPCKVLASPSQPPLPFAEGRCHMQSFWPQPLLHSCVCALVSLTQLLACSGLPLFSGFCFFVPQSDTGTLCEAVDSGNTKMHRMSQVPHSKKWTNKQKTPKSWILFFSTKSSFSGKSSKVAVVLITVSHKQS